MKLKETITWKIPVLFAVVVLLISSCGQAGFDVGINVPDSGAIPLNSLSKTVVIQAEFAVSTGNIGIDLNKLIYKYSLLNNGSDKITLHVRLSLYGTAKVTDTGPTIRVIPPDSEPSWLASSYENKVVEEGGSTKGWVTMIVPVDIDKNITLSKSITLSSNPVVNQILKQDTLWIVADISTSSLLSFNNTLNITGQSIEAVGTKPTGYFPGAFGGL